MIELNNKLMNVYRGVNKVSKVFLGSSLIYPTEFSFEDNLLVWLDGRDYFGSPSTWTNKATKGANVTIGMSGSPYGSGLKVLFNGISQYGIFPNVFSDVMGFQNTTIIKFKLKSNPSGIKGVFGLTGAGDYNRCQLYRDKSGKFMVILGAKTATLSELPEVDKWYTIAWRGDVKNSDAIDYFVNGAWYKGDAPNATSVYAAKQFLIGAYGAQDGLGILANSYSNLEFASAYVYDRLLSNEEIENIYNYENTIDRDSRIKYEDVLQTKVYYDKNKDVFKIQSPTNSGYKWGAFSTTGDIDKEYVFEVDVYGAKEWFTYKYDSSTLQFPYRIPVDSDITIDMPFLQKLKFNYIPIENDPNSDLLIYANNPFSARVPAEARVFLQGLKTYKYEGETNHFNIRKLQGVAGFGLNTNIFSGGYESIKNGSARGWSTITDLINMKKNTMYNVDIVVSPNSRNYRIFLGENLQSGGLREWVFINNKVNDTTGAFAQSCKFLNLTDTTQISSYFLSNSTVGNVCIVSSLRISEIENYFNIEDVIEKSNVDILNDIENNKITLTKNAEGQFGNVKYNIPNLKDNTKYYVIVDNLNNIGKVYIEASQGFKNKERIELNEVIPTNAIDESMPSLQGVEFPTGTKYQLEFVKEPSKTYKLVLETTENAPIGTVSEFDKMYIWTDNEIVYTIPQDGLIGKYELPSFVAGDEVNKSVWKNMILDDYNLTFNVNPKIENNMIVLDGNIGADSPTFNAQNDMPYTMIVAYYPYQDFTASTGIYGQVLADSRYKRFGFYGASGNKLMIMMNKQGQITDEPININELNISALGVGNVGENVSIYHNGVYKDLYLKQNITANPYQFLLLSEIGFTSSDKNFVGGYHSIYLWDRKLNEIEIKQVNEYIKKNSENVLPRIPFNYLNGFQNMRVNQTYDNIKGIVRMECTEAGTYNYGGIGLTELDFGTYEIHFNVYANNGYNTYFNPGTIRTSGPILADITIDAPFVERKILEFTIDETNKGLLKLLFYYGDIPANSSVPGDLIYVDDIVIYKKG